MDSPLGLFMRVDRMPRVGTAPVIRRRARLEVMGERAMVLVHSQSSVRALQATT
jgi:hypothetical protein